jgi:acetoin utilization protein AcuC
LAIYHFVDRGKRVIYLDIDAHHGDGVQWAFYDDPTVLTISFHQDGRTLFPGSGELTEVGRGEGTGYAVNVPMLPGTDDHVFWEGFSLLVPRLMDAFKPDVVVSQLGVDTFGNDPLATLELTTYGFCQAVSYLTEHAPAWVALGGGGYNPSNVARAWTLAWATMNEMDLPDDIPEAMVKSMAAGGFKGVKLRDHEYRSPWRQQCLKHMQKCVQYLEKHIFPKITAS